MSNENQIKVNSSFLSFKESREYARKLNLKSRKEWCEKVHPKYIYRRPDIAFKNKGWTNWHDFLIGTKVRYLSFKETQEYAISLNLKSCKDWLEIKHPYYIYRRPDSSFKNKGWTNWTQFLLGTNVKFLSLELTKEYARGLNITSSRHWCKIKHPKHVCKNPDRFFKNKGWTNWYDFLGKIRRRKYAKYAKKVSFNVARNYARGLNLKSKREWDKINHPLYIYSNPEDRYKNKGWTNWYDFLGKIKNEYLDFEETRNYARSLNINSIEQWNALRHPKNIYKRPQLSFKNKGWTNWYDFLGKYKKFESF